MLTSYDWMRDGWQSLIQEREKTNSNYKSLLKIDVCGCNEVLLTNLLGGTYSSVTTRPPTRANTKGTAIVG